MPSRLVSKALPLAGAIAIFGVATVHAGERNGRGEEVPGGENGRSICSYSGLEDFDFLEPVSPGTVQNWGIIPKVVRDMLSLIGLHPGDSCSPGKPADDDDDEGEDS